MKKLAVKKLDIIIVLAVLIVSAISFFAINAFSSGGDVVVIQVDNTVVDTLPLNVDTEYNINSTNTLVISDKKAFVSSANCPDKICVHHKPISKNNESIVCLPNKVVITVSSSDTEIDGVAR